MNHNTLDRNHQSVSFFWSYFLIQCRYKTSQFPRIEKEEVNKEEEIRVLLKTQNVSSSSSNAAISQSSFLTSTASLFPSDPDTRSTVRSKSAKIPSTPSGGPILSTEKDMDNKVLLAEENVVVSGLSPKHQQKPQREFACGAPLAFLSACGSHVASATWTNTIHLWNLDKESSWGFRLNVAKEKREKECEANWASLWLISLFIARETNGGTRASTTGRNRHEPIAEPT